MRLTSLVHTQPGSVWRCIAGRPSHAHVHVASGGCRPQKCEAARLLCLRCVALLVPCLLQSFGSQFGNCPSPRLQSGHNHDPPSPGDPGLQAPRLSLNTSDSFILNTLSLLLSYRHSYTLSTGSHKHLSDTPDMEGGHLAICFEASPAVTSKIAGYFKKKKKSLC